MPPRLRATHAPHHRVRGLSRACARTVAGIAETKRAAFRDETYWARPVPGFGDASARLLVLGLAPAAHGANRTGRVFTGDGVNGSGDFLMRAMMAGGFANRATSHRPDDGLVLTDAYIAAAVRCAPPDNKPTPEEVDDLPRPPRGRARGAARTSGSWSCSGASRTTPIAACSRVAA